MYVFSQLFSIIFILNSMISFSTHPSTEMCKTEFSSPKELSNGSLIAYQWKIENKYYTADVQLCASSVSSLPPQCEFAANMNFQSVIIAFDLSEVSQKRSV